MPLDPLVLFNVVLFKGHIHSTPQLSGLASMQCIISGSVGKGVGVRRGAEKGNGGGGRGEGEGGGKQQHVCQSASPRHR